MPKQIVLVNQEVSVDRGTEIDSKASKEAGAPIVVETWTLVLTDRTYHDQHRITLRREARDGLVSDLTGGIVLAGGDLPQKPAPDGFAGSELPDGI